jgi:hypothetical protein
MTRPKSVRQAAKNKARDCCDLPILRRVWVQLTPKYALELALLNGGTGVYPVQIFWHPQEPSAVEMLTLQGPLADEIADLSKMALKHDGGAT